MSTRSSRLNWWQATKSASVDEISRIDGLGPEAQVRGGHGTGLLRVVDEVALHEVVGRVDDDLGAVLVRPDGAVRPEPEEDGLNLGVAAGSVGSPWSQGMLREVTSSKMPTVKWRLGRSLLSSSRAALAMAGVNSLEDSPYRPPITRGQR